MSEIPVDIEKTLLDFIQNLKKEIGITSAIVFGSYAQSRWNKDSDIDIAVFSDFFSHKDRAESIAFLLNRTLNYDLDIQPIAFDSEDFENYKDNPFINEIVTTGIRIA